MNVYEIPNYQDQENQLPIEAGAKDSSETNLLSTSDLVHEGEIQFQTIKETYLDKDHNLALPVFAAASVKFQGGCRLISSLLPRRPTPIQTSRAGSLARQLSTIPCWETEIEATNKQVINPWPISLYHSAIFCVGIIISTVVIALIGEFQVKQPIQTILSIIIASALLFIILEIILTGIFGLHERILTKIYPNTPAFREVHGTTFSKEFSSKLPGSIPEDARNFIKEHLNKYQDIHLVWNATNLWESKEIKPGKSLNRNILVFGETENNKFVFLGDFHTNE